MSVVIRLFLLRQISVVRYDARGGSQAKGTGMGDVVCGKWYDRDGRGKRHWHWEVILPVAFSAVSAVATVATLILTLLGR
ncbi:MAG: hypothetical protein QJR02_11375 [Sinobacteraceae bacterium]|nr:hypothetical protein [Nevskiaceae bacterium]